MNLSLVRTLTADEQQLVLATEPKRLDALDEDALLTLHDRVRRARNKYSKLYRRQASAQVRADAARGKASAKNQGTAVKAELFEDALARVSRRLAAAARRSAADLRAERIAAAKAARKAPGSRRAPAARPARTAKAAPRTTTTGRRGDAALRSPATKRASAQTRSAGRRAQAKRDTR